MSIAEKDCICYGKFEGAHTETCKQVTREVVNRARLKVPNLSVAILVDPPLPIECSDAAIRFLRNIFLKEQFNDRWVTCYQYRSRHTREDYYFYYCNKELTITKFPAHNITSMVEIYRGRIHV